MKKWIAFIGICWCQFAMAQVAEHVWEGIESPVVHADKRVTFQYYAPDADTVKVSGDFRWWIDYSNIMSKGSDGETWTLTTPSLPPGIYRYYFVVDGMPAPDQYNPDRRYHGSAGDQSMLLVPGETAKPWEVHADIAHGKIIEEKFYSEVFERVVSCFLYLPPGYDETDVSYPVVYMQHGRGDDAGNWVYDGFIDRVADYQIAHDEMEPMIIVMPDGNNHDRYFPGKKEPKGDTRDAHERYVLTEVIPFAEQRYRIDTSNRAIAGLSMGGGQTINVATRNPALFKAVGPFSAVVYKDFGLNEKGEGNLAEIHDALNRWDVFYIPIGSKDFLLKANQYLIKRLQLAEIQHEYYEAPGIGHCWPFWTQQAGLFLKKFSASIK
jgi:enterochelin esterase-like enzyme